ncbi:hypothetical protein ACFR9U_14800 [Halorientalis brevis]|uniref:Uncharacterized protein n=1 Tax=Halorientalis brevis TaxID=1126241 RepID=A0ABD6CFR8_9EURY|nr:hypothetical protein [Halorientalis brevis]
MAESEVFTVDERYEGFEFTLHNQTQSAVAVETTNGWEITAHSSDGWEQIATQDGVGTDGKRTLDCEEKHTWHLALFEHPTPHGRTTTYVFVDLFEGLYKFTVTGSLETGEELTREAQFEVRRRLPSETRTDD